MQSNPGQVTINFGTLSKLSLAALTCGLLMIVGSFGPWAKVRVFLSSMSVNGTEDGRDGVLTLGLGLVVVVMAILALRAPSRRLWPALMLACFLLAAVIGIYDWADISSVADQSSTELDESIFGEDAGQFFSVEAAWGLQLMTFASVAGAAASVVDLTRWRARSAVPQSVPTAPTPEPLDPS